MSGNEFPRMMFRDGTQEVIWGVPCDTKTVNDYDEQEAAQADGWRLTPTAPDPKFDLLDESAATIVEHLPALTRAELVALIDAEQKGKTRKGVIGPLTAALAAMDEPAPADEPAAEEKDQTVE